MQTDEGERVQVFEDKVSIAGGIDRIGCWGDEAQLARGNVAVKRKRCAGYCA